jgi:hypothetical protein
MEDDLEIISEERPAHTGTGKWRQPGVPHRGWTCTEVVDLFDDGDDFETCEMCETAQIRYAHIMTHPDYSDALAVGCICAEHMEQDYVGPKRREREFRQRQTRAERELRRQQKPEVAAALTFVTATDEIIEHGGLSTREENFVYDMRARAKHNAAPRTRTQYGFTGRQLRWLRDIYLRIPIGQRTWKTTTEIEHCRSFEIEQRKQTLLRVGIFPFPTGWDSDLTGSDYVPLPGLDFGAPHV